ncbi:hypothetical protein BMS3Bbin15_01069 [archaeon BMS3Bbin15]|nr:hypothetical protein BMS3Bbin15_01069 [archaeon BMS3Bbin15]
MYQVLAEELHEYLGIAGIEVGYDKCDPFWVEVSAQKLFDGALVLFVEEFLCYNPAGDPVQQGQPILLGPAFFRMLLVIVNYLNILHRWDDGAADRAVKRPVNSVLAPG